jgi:hypothetical protein
LQREAQQPAALAHRGVQVPIRAQAYARCVWLECFRSSLCVPVAPNAREASTSLQTAVRAASIAHWVVTAPARVQPHASRAPLAHTGRRPVDKPAPVLGCVWLAATEVLARRPKLAPDLAPEGTMEARRARRPLTAPGRAQPASLAQRVRRSAPTARPPSTAPKRPPRALFVARADGA